MAEEGHISARNHGRKEASAPMECGTPPEILPIETAFNFPLFPSLFIFTSLWLFLAHLLLVFWLFFGFFNKPCYNDFFSTFLSPRGQVFFSTALNFMEEYSGYAVSLLLQDQSTKWTDLTRVKLIQVHKVDGPHQGSKLVHEMDGPNQGQTYTSPQSERTPPRVKTSPQSGRTQPGSNVYKSTKWTDPTKGQN